MRLPIYTFVKVFYVAMELLVLVQSRAHWYSLFRIPLLIKFVFRRMFIQPKRSSEKSKRKSFDDGHLK
jgi:hypothetical protein